MTTPENTTDKLLRHADPRVTVKHAAQAEDAGATSFLHARVRPLDKASWVRAANKRAQRQRARDARGNLAGWVVDSLNAAAKSPLIAAAPELLEALRQQQEALEYLFDSRAFRRDLHATHTNALDKCRDAMAAAAAAIAKATA